MKVGSWIVGVYIIIMIMFRNNFISLNVYYNQLKVHSTEQSPAYDIATFLCKFNYLQIKLPYFSLAQCVSCLFKNQNNLLAQYNATKNG